MKKIYLAALTLAMTACVSNDDLNPVDNYGYIDVKVSNDPIVETRAIVSSTELPNWNVKVTKGNDQKFNEEVSKLSSKSFEAGTDYSLEVYNYVDDNAAHSDNENWGAARYNGRVEGFEVKNGQTNEAYINCGSAQNTRVVVEYNESFTNKVEQGYSLTTSSGNRSHIFNSTTSGKHAYYTAGSEISYTLAFKFLGQSGEKTVSGKINSESTLGGKENKIKVQMNTNGSITLKVEYEDFTTALKDLIIDGGTGQEQIK